MSNTSSQNAFAAREQLLPILALALCLSVIGSSKALAQAGTVITPTSGLGDLETAITSHGNTIQITGGTRPSNGTNLFHSFDQFSVGRPDTAQFLNTTPSLPTSNILGRVTGGNPSSIFGSIDTMSYPGANLFLMNPAGIVFGPNATLHVGGSVAFTTADYLRLAETNGSHAGIFHAETASTSLLTTASVAAFGFLGTNPSAISIQGIPKSELRVQPGQSITLVGGNQKFAYNANSVTGASVSVPGGVTVTGRHLLAPGGQVNIASGASPGEILAETLDQTANINGQSFGALGTIEILQQSRIDTSGNGGGTILIRGGQLIVDNSTISSNMTGLDARPLVHQPGTGIDIQMAESVLIKNRAVLGVNPSDPVLVDGSSGEIRIKANQIEIVGIPDFEEFPFTGILSGVAPKSVGGKRGDITLEANSIAIRDLGQLATTTNGVDDAGHITLKAIHNIDLDTAIISSHSEAASGNAGHIEVSSAQGNISIQNNTILISYSSKGGNGAAGSLTLRAPQGDIILTNRSFVFNRAEERTTGTLGGIQITARDLHLLSGSRIEGDNFSTQVAGNILIMLDGRLILAGGSKIETATSGPADAAELIINASNILIADTSSLFTGTTGAGAGGEINLSAQSLTIQNSGKISASTSGTAPSAIGGSITVKTTDHVTMTGGASITASSTGPGNAGNISINAGQQLDLVGKSSITTQAKTASGGNIDIQAVDHIRLVNSSINTSVFGGAGNGGNITIDPNVVVLQSSQVIAEAFQGVGGDITITTPLFLTDSTSKVSALSPFGLNGTVTIQSPTSNLSESLGTLPSNPSQAHSLLTQRCAALVNNGQASSFVVAGREQLPSDPGGWLSSPLALVSLGESLDAGHAVASTPAVIAMATQDTGTVSLRRLTPAGFLMANFAESEATGCHS